MRLAPRLSHVGCRRRVERADVRRVRGRILEYGSYVLRRSEVDGATAEQRRWHLYSAKIARDSTE
jgi:hypothetical protein